MSERQQTEQHPAMRAWTRLRKRGQEPRAVETLNDTKKTRVFRLLGAGADGAPIIAKRCRRETAGIERIVYEEVLPELPLLALKFYGFVPDEDEAFAWLFLEDAGGIAYDPENRQHCALAADWLAALHSVALPEDVTRRLASRQAPWYRSELQAAYERIAAGLDNPSLSAEDRAILQRLLVQCAAVTAMWPRIEAFCAQMPFGLVHGDFVEKNLRVRLDAAGPVLRVFDWEVAGWGGQAADVAQCPDLAAYARATRFSKPQLKTEDVRRVADCGRIFRLIAGMSWSSWRLAYARVERAMRCLRCYEADLPLQLRTLARGA